VRFREDKPEDLARARAAVAAWREQHPQGTYDQLTADLGAGFHSDYGPVLRSVLFALESRDAKVTAGMPVIEVPDD
jgi:hypothetical protein